MTAILTSAPLLKAQTLNARSETYSLLAQAFSFPDQQFFETVQDGEWESQLRTALGQLPCRFRTSGLVWRAPPAYDDLQTEYIRLFQVSGRRGPPCPLHEGHYTRDRGRTLQSLIRFYNFFGFRVVECVMPDHLSVQLEFMSELAGDGAEDVESRLRAQRDFLAAHLGWTAELARRVAAARPHPFYRSLTALTSRLVAADARSIQQINGRL